MSLTPKVGLLPLYLKLYDDAKPEMRPRMEAFLNTIRDALAQRGLDVTAADVCRVRPEFKDAVNRFEEADCDLIVTLHLAYSPSEEAAPALAATRLPILMLDTTPAEAFDAGVNSEEIFFNHGIHGVQDLANVLRRRGKRYHIEAGHWRDSDALDRAARWARAAAAARRMRRARVGRIGEPFKGMGDFFVEPLKLRALLGVETAPAAPQDVAEFLPAPDAPEVEEEMRLDRERFDMPDVSEDAHRRTTRACLAVRRFLEANELTAFSMNFGAITADSGLPCVPFLEACKAMERGLGYAGEGDVVTAALVAALAGAYGQTTFTEMFCPDWRGGSVFLSHMGEVNLSLAAGKPRLFEKPWPYTDAAAPASVACGLRPGPAVLVNLAPGPEDSFSLVAARGEILDPGDDANFRDSVRAWFKPKAPLREFLKEYSYAGGTHHSALVYGDAAGDINRFASMLGLDLLILDRESVVVAYSD